MTLMPPPLPSIFGSSDGDAVPDFQVVSQQPEKMVERLQRHDFTPLFRVIIADLEEDHTAFFAGERSPTGEPWAPLKESTVERKKHDTILKEKGRLWGSVAADDPPHAIREFIDEQLTKGFLFGTDHPAARKHDQGTSKMPARVFLGFTEERKARISEMVLDEVARVLTGAAGEGL